MKVRVIYTYDTDAEQFISPDAGEHDHTFTVISASPAVETLEAMANLPNFRWGYGYFQREDGTACSRLSDKLDEYTLPELAAELEVFCDDDE